jgi:hypothetical protein
METAGPQRERRGGVWRLRLSTAAGIGPRRRRKIR